MNSIVVIVFLVVMSMVKRKEISVEVIYPIKEEELKELEYKKAKIIFSILREKYGDEILKEYIINIKN
ncbi:hypothetical protein SDC9_161222 [bioreactor metagenome]|uniref:Uncharacterized protein n=1 Tax=bioreactor metagenome TaxID=1076179 RepID=A0A645FJR3_9ZZZZ